MSVAKPALALPPITPEDTRQVLDYTVVDDLELRIVQLNLLRGGQSCEYWVTLESLCVVLGLTFKNNRVRIRLANEGFAGAIVRVRVSPITYHHQPATSVQLADALAAAEILARTYTRYRDLRLRMQARLGKLRAAWPKIEAALVDDDAPGSLDYVRRSIVEGRVAVKPALIDEHVFEPAPAGVVMRPLYAFSPNNEADSPNRISVCQDDDGAWCLRVTPASAAKCGNNAGTLLADQRRRIAVRYLDGKLGYVSCVELDRLLEYVKEHKPDAVAYVEHALRFVKVAEADYAMATPKAAEDASTELCSAVAAARDMMVRGGWASHDATDREFDRVFFALVDRTAALMDCSPTRALFNISTAAAVVMEALAVEDAARHKAVEEELAAVRAAVPAVSDTDLALLDELHRIRDDESSSTTFIARMTLLAKYCGDGKERPAANGKAVAT